MAHKIATCVYCGTRSALVLTGKTRHELSCSSCGAPLHDLKKLKTNHVEDSHRVKSSPLQDWHGSKPHRQKKKSKKKKKSFKKRLFDEAFDILDDIFD